MVAVVAVTAVTVTAVAVAVTAVTVTAVAVAVAAVVGRGSSSVAYLGRLRRGGAIVRKPGLWLGIGLGLGLARSRTRPF